MKNLYIKETEAHKSDAVVKAYKKQIKVNRIAWIAGSAVGLIVTIIMIVVGLNSKWEGRILGIAIGIPAVLTALAIVMTVFIWLGNEIGVKMYKTDKITFYSGPWSNALYLNDQLVYKGSSEHKMVATLCDKSLCKIMLKTLSFTINILPPGSDPVTGLPPKKQETVATEIKKEEETKPQA